MEHTRSNTAALLLKELRLSTSPLTVIFLAFTLMVFIPGYPVLVSAFFVCLGIFQSFQLARETGDILYTALLPVRKRDVPRAKLLSVSFFQLISVLLASVFTVIRLCFMSALPPYADNPLMPACPTLIAFMLIVYAEFNYIFVRGFIRTAYRLGAPVCAIYCRRDAYRLHLRGSASSSRTRFSCRDRRTRDSASARPACRRRRALRSRNRCLLPQRTAPLRACRPVREKSVQFPTLYCKKKKAML